MNRLAKLSSNGRKQTSMKFFEFREGKNAKVRKCENLLRNTKKKRKETKRTQENVRNKFVIVFPTEKEEKHGRKQIHFMFFVVGRVWFACEMVHTYTQCECEIENKQMKK